MKAEAWNCSSLVPTLIYSWAYFRRKMWAPSIWRMVCTIEWELGNTRELLPYYEHLGECELDLTCMYLEVATAASAATLEICFSRFWMSLACLSEALLKRVSSCSRFLIASFPTFTSSTCFLISFSAWKNPQHHHRVGRRRRRRSTPVSKKAGVNNNVYVHKISVAMF